MYAPGSLSLWQYEPARVPFGHDAQSSLHLQNQLIGAETMIRTEETPDFSVALVNPQSPTEPCKRVTLSSFSAGARHRSALVFCYLNPGAAALVVSHDGVMSLLTRPVMEDCVVALRPLRRGTPLAI